MDDGWMGLWDLIDIKWKNWEEFGDRRRLRTLFSLYNRMR